MDGFLSVEDMSAHQADHAEKAILRRREAKALGVDEDTLLIERSNLCRKPAVTAIAPLCTPEQPVVVVRRASLFSKVKSSVCGCFNTHLISDE